MSGEATLAARLAAIRRRIAAAVESAGRAPGEVTLVAVSKGQPAEAIREAYALGQRDFGENYVQELAGKAAALCDLTDLRWHFIGALQRNKVRQVIGAVSLLHTVDRVELVAELDRRLAAANARLDVLLEVNVGGEASKSGCAPDELGELLAAVLAAPTLSARGLMTIPPPADGPELVRPFFRRLRDLRDRHARATLTELSMGMSDDFEVAIAEGSTLVRVGTAIFGPRHH